jgi:hypothetical protein
MASRRKVVQIPPGEAVFLIEALTLDGRIDSKTLDEYRSRYSAEIQSLERRLAQLRAATGGSVVIAAAGAAVAAAGRTVVRAARRVRQKTATKTRKSVSPKRARTRELQGRYLGLMHQIPKAVVKSQFGKDAIAKKGKETVIVEMQAFISNRDKSKNRKG